MLSGVFGRLRPRRGAVDVLLSDRFVGGWRRAALAGTHGTVIEFGFGSGANLAHYPPEVERVLAVEPDDIAWSRAEPKIYSFAKPVTRVGPDAAALDLPDDSADTAVSSWTMCSIADLSAALTGLHKILRPGGAFHFVEHSVAPTPIVAGVQRLLQPAWGPIAHGCHLDRDIPAELARTGWEVQELSCRYLHPFPLLRPWGWFCAGRAVSGLTSTQRGE